jgi:hypothetical protein
MDAASRLRDASLTACWRQWRALGASLSRASSAQARFVVDVEALLLMSLRLVPTERRLEDAVAWWAATSSRLVSVQRLRTLARHGPPDSARDVADFAAFASRAGDHRWARLAGKRKQPPRALKGPEQAHLDAGVTLMPRLRAAFGVGAKADVLLLLLTAPRPEATARDLSMALDYTARAVRDAAEDMVLAGLLEAHDERPRRYFVRREPWSELLLDGGALPHWRPWSGAFLLVSHLLTDAEALARKSAYLRASATRDLVERHARRLEQVHGLPQLPKATADAYLPAFERYADELATWIEEA